MAADREIRFDPTRFRPSRRAFVITGAAALTRLRAMPATPSCTLIAEQEMGPYYIQNQILRQNITEDRPGLPLKLRIALVDAKSCRPLTSAALDIWHCDALGVYSGFAANSSGGPGGRGPRGGIGEFSFGPGMPPPPGPGMAGPGGRGGPGGPGGPGGGPPPESRITDAKRFLRGIQLTGEDGIAEFTTLYPGWYSGRAIHIHLKVHLGGHGDDGKYAGGHVSHTGQLFLPEEITGEVAKLQPYEKRLGVYRTLQSEDHVFNGQHGSASMLSLARLAARTNADGFVGNVTLAVDRDANPAPVGGPGGRRGPEFGR
jgi:protocatechuate 3,4-dioxygenase beta subunit